MPNHLAAAILGLTLALPAAAAADGVRLYDFDGDFEDAAFSVETAIIDQGLVVDSVSHIGTMLQRTAADVGATTRLFENAEIYQFCSAVLSRKVMEADPTNIVFCPYSIFVIEPADGSGKTRIGHRIMPDGPMKEVEALLERIATEAAGG